MHRLKATLNVKISKKMLQICQKLPLYLNIYLL